MGEYRRAMLTLLSKEPRRSWRKELHSRRKHPQRMNPISRPRSRPPTNDTKARTTTRMMNGICSSHYPQSTADRPPSQPPTLASIVISRAITPRTDNRNNSNSHGYDGHLDRRLESQLQQKTSKTSQTKRIKPCKGYQKATTMTKNRKYQ